MNRFIGKILYGLLFVVALPISLLFWGKRLDIVIKELPVITSTIVGLLLVAAGLSLLLSGWRAIIKYGKGLPMNAFPPKHLVSQSIYAIIPHPIYVGFVTIVAGCSIYIGSAAGLWVVTPTVALFSVALVLGYERHSLEQRFDTSSWQTAIRLPPDSDEKPLLSDRLSVYVLVFLPWLIVYEAVIVLGSMPDAFETYLIFEQTLPVIEWTEIIYAFTYLFVLAAPLFARRQKDLRTFMLMGLCATLLGVMAFVLLPFKATPRPFEVTSSWGQLLLIEQSLDGSAGAFPSFHVIWALLAAWLYSRTSRLGTLWYIVAGVITLSCITTGMHSLFDIVGAILAYIFVINMKRIWLSLLNLTERLANSWREWRIGRTRLIVHGMYVGIGALVGVVVAAHLAGEDHAQYVLLVSFASLIGAGIWGQIIEGSSILSRPFGYYGGLLGGILGVVISVGLGSDGWQLAGAFSVAGPFVQAIGRLRCLVQGCCHGRECSSEQGIVVSHERSRVLYLAGLGNRPIYPTQLYSIFYNVVLGAFLIRAWTLSVPMPLVIGIYLLFGGIGRFVEESYRGEPQTPKSAGLAVYQWLAMVSVLAGAIIMTYPGKPCTVEVTILPWLIFYAAAFGVIVAIAMGVDFPESKKPFSRLT